MVPIKTIQDLISKHSSLEKELSSGQIEKKQYAEKSKEYSDLNDIIKEAKQYSFFDKEKKELEKIFNDTATTEIYTSLFVGSVRCVLETGP